MLQTKLAEAETKLTEAETKLAEAETKLAEAEMENFRLTNRLNSSESTLHLATRGFTRGQIDSFTFQSLLQMVAHVAPQESGKITGKYKMLSLDVKSLRDLAGADLHPFGELAANYLSHRYGMLVQVIMDEAALLMNPEPIHGRSETAQICHTDSLSGTGVTFIVSLTDNCLSTYCLSTQYYGADYPRDITIDELIGYNYLAKPLGDRRISDAVCARYRPVCGMTPDEFFGKADGGQVVQAGHFTAFRDDLLHAGPSGNQGRQVLFLHYRAQSSNNPQEGLQYRIDTLMQVCGYKKEKRKAIYELWLKAGHWSPYKCA